MGQTAQGDVVRDPMRLLVEMFNYDFASVEDRLRLLLIFALIKGKYCAAYLWFQTKVNAETCSLVRTRNKIFQINSNSQ